MSEANQVTYLRWLYQNHPDLYAHAIAGAQSAESTARTLGYIDEEEGLGFINFIIQALATVGSAVIGKKQVDKQVSLQKKALALSDMQASADRSQTGQLALLEVNTKRAQAGLPPVDINGRPVSASSLPLPAALRPYTNVSGAIVPGVPNMVTYALGGLAAFALLRRFKVL